MNSLPSSVITIYSGNVIYNFEKDCKMYIVFLVSYNYWICDYEISIETQENIPFISEKHHFNSDSLEGVYVKQERLWARKWCR